MRCRILALALLAATVAAAPVAAIPATQVLPSAEPPVIDGGDVPFLTDEPDDPALDDPEVRKLAIQLERERLKAQIERTRFAAAMDTYQANMYRHHQFWTDAAAVAVYLITLFGLVCAAAQFRLMARLRGEEVAEDTAPSAGEVALPGGAKVNSPFLGVIILFLSLGFFYLYLTNVYPILSVAEIEAKRTAGSAAPAGDDPAEKKPGRKRRPDQEYGSEE